MPTTGPEPACLAAARRWAGAPLETARLHLRPPVEGDVPAILSLAGEWEVARLTAFIPHPYAEADAHRFLAGAALRRRTGREILFAIERRGEPGLIGMIGATLAEDGAGAELGYWLGRAHWGRGYGPEAIRRLARLLIGTLGLDRLTAGVMAENAPSMRALEKAGFARMGEGVGSCCQGRCAGQATVTFALTAESWRAAEAQRPTLLVVAVALIDADGRVLLAQRPAGKSMAGLWEFPGGKVHEGETPEAALIRELDEELGLDIAESCLAPFTFASHAYEDFHLLMPLYVCRVWKGTPSPREGQALKWVRPTDLRAYPMPPADEPLVAMLRDFL
jgi:8-oxo-dGTP diphosphatase